MSPPAPRRLVVDTDVVSFFFKGDTRSALYRPHLDGRLLVISFMTVRKRYRTLVLQRRVVAVQPSKSRPVQAQVVVAMLGGQVGGVCARCYS